MARFEEKEERSSQTAFKEFQQLMERQEGSAKVTEEQPEVSEKPKEEEGYHRQQGKVRVLCALDILVHAVRPLPSGCSLRGGEAHCQQAAAGRVGSVRSG